ncbi:hypothetical protein SHJG_p1043 (plasmid) [Streptomyces hygroscopicus subsp. jinggangensis 5008]|nr:hypothetical protein SHJG_p1043 [Streptomyces hygroscopicus subsp. jinggangensis 5008]AGF68328.1 hypothetical protein SHJGH_p1043 [Streptomyces hygroscopicus subsp. jinggangensis TL01]
MNVAGTAASPTDAGVAVSAGAAG